MTAWSLQLFLKMNWNTNFCQSPLPLEPPPPFLPAFLACFSLLFGRTNLILSFCTSPGQCRILCPFQMLWPHQSRRRLASLAAQHAAPSEYRRMEDKLWALSQAVLSALFASLQQSVGFPGCDHPARLLWKFCWQSNVDQKPEKNTALSLSGGTGRLAELPTLRGMTFGTVWMIPPRHKPRLGSAIPGLPGLATVPHHPFVRLRPGRRVHSAQCFCLSIMWKQERRFLSQAGAKGNLTVTEGAECGCKC